jgi:2-polyprenyl-3-methyl-5-hydroxy-6-metoxy-1,4-benzoquinol methylase
MNDMSIEMSKNADSANAEFWNYLCGTNAAMYMGFDLDTREGVRQFDNWYMDSYPYLQAYIDDVINNAETCLEVGIGLGTVSRYLSRNVHELLALDVASEPCIFLQKSLEGENNNLQTINLSVLEGEFSTSTDSEFDCAIAIGSLHHSGNLELALDNLIGSVKPGGKILVMVYNEFSLYRLVKNPVRFFLRFLQSKFGQNYTWSENDETVRSVNDSNNQGSAAPHTSYSSRRLFTSRSDSKWKVNSENLSDFIIFEKYFERRKFLHIVKNAGGLDLYATGIKGPKPGS